MKKLTEAYVKSLIQKWDNGEIYATTYYYRIARRILKEFDLQGEDHSSIIGIVEVYNMSK
jgi:hypothetical protein